MKNKKRILKLLFILIIILYVIFTFANQQKTLNQYAKNCKELETQIAEQKDYKEELAKKKQAIESKQFIEDTAREKLDMYLPNEKVYMDTGY